MSDSVYELLMSYGYLLCWSAFRCQQIRWYQKDRL